MGPVRLHHGMGSTRGCRAVRTRAKSAGRTWRAGRRYVTGALPGCHAADEGDDGSTSALQDPRQRSSRPSVSAFLAAGQTRRLVQPFLNRRWRPEGTGVCQPAVPRRPGRDQRPFTSARFVHHAGRLGCSFLRRPTSTDAVQLYPPEVAGRYGNRAAEHLLKEQYLDFLKCGVFARPCSVIVMWRLNRAGPGGNGTVQ